MHLVSKYALFSLILLCGFQAQGQLVFDQAHVFDGYNDVWVQDLDVDAVNNQYLAACHSSWIVLPQLKRKLTTQGFVASFVLKIDASGTYEWAKTFDARKGCRIQKIALSDDGTVATTGYFTGDDLWIDGEKLPSQPEANNNLTQPNHAFIAVFDNNGSLLWHKIYKAGQATGMGVAIDNNHQVYAWLSYYRAIKGPDIDKEHPDHLWKKYHESNELLVKYDARGKLLFLKEFPDTNNRFHVGKTCHLTLDPKGNLYAVYVWRKSFNLGAIPLSNDGYMDGFDHFVAKFSPALEPLWVSQIGGEGDQSITSMSWGANDKLLISGTYSFECTIGSGKVKPVEVSAFKYKSGTSLFMFQIDTEGEVSEVKFQQGDGYNGYFTSSTTCMDAQGITHSFGWYIGHASIRNNDGTTIEVGNVEDKQSHAYYATWKGNQIERIHSLDALLPHSGVKFANLRNGWLWMSGPLLMENSVTLRNGSTIALTDNMYGNSAFLLSSYLGSAPEVFVGIEDEPEIEDLAEESLAGSIEEDHSTNQKRESPETEAAIETIPDKPHFSANLYPNPAKNMVYVHVNGLDEVQLYFTDLNGKILLAHRAAFTTNDHKMPFDISSLASGTYLVVINGQSERKTLRFVKG